jgi:undecaprenyl-diphosphatase
MLGASFLKAVKYLIVDKIEISSQEWLILAVGCIVAFVVSLIAIRFLTDFVKKHTFIPFGIYRIILGIVVALWAFLK